MAVCSADRHDTFSLSQNIECSNDLVAVIYLNLKRSAFGKTGCTKLLLVESQEYPSDTSWFI